MNAVNPLNNCHSVNNSNINNISKDESHALTSSSEDDFICSFLRMSHKIFSVSQRNEIEVVDLLNSSRCLLVIINTKSLLLDPRSSRITDSSYVKIQNPLLGFCPFSSYVSAQFPFREFIRRMPFSSLR